jgi:hypothetical protein
VAVVFDVPCALLREAAPPPAAGGGGAAQRSGARPPRQTRMLQRQMRTLQRTRSTATVAHVCCILAPWLHAYAPEERPFLPKNKRHRSFLAPLTAGAPRAGARAADRLKKKTSLKRAVFHI